MTAIESSTWDIHTALPISTSVLYPLMPQGVGTPHVESLTSYLKRLAHAHHLKVVDMVTFCSTQTDAHVLPSTLQKLSRIDGMTDSGGAWSVLLQKLTCQEEVVCLTMHYWRSLLNPYRMLRQHHAWCPLCFADATQQRNPVYESLAWRLQDVEVCTIHQCSLIETCPNCDCQFTTLSNWAVVGYCPKCQSWLGDSACVDPKHSLDAEVSKRAGAVGKLLSLAPQRNLTRWNRIAKVIPHLRQQYCTTYTHLAQVMHTKASAVSLLLAEGRQPNLEMFSRLAAYLGEPFWQTLIQPNGATQVCIREPESNTPQAYIDHLLTSPQRLPSLSNIARHCGFDTVTAFRKAFPTHHDVFWQRIHAAQRVVLEQALQQEPPVVLSKWAAQHGHRIGDLYHHFYDLCVQVTQRCQTDKQKRCRHYLEQTLKRKNFPAFTFICQTLKVSDHYLKQHFADQIQVIEAKRQQHLEHRETFIREYLDQILTEDKGVVSLEQIAQTVGKSTRYLKNKFPLQSQTLLRRRRVSAAQHIQTTCDRICQSVFDLHEQGIYPSVDRIHAVIDSWMVHDTAYRRAYIEAMTMCGYISASTQPL
jgi:AraC-like DNA-binding protein